MSPGRFDELTAALLDGSLSETERAELLEAAMADPKQGQALVALLRLDPLLRDALAQSADSAGFAGRVQNSLQSTSDSQAFAASVLTKLRQRERPAWRSRPAVAAAAVLFLTVLGIAFRGHLSPSAVIAQVEISEGGKVYLVTDGGEKVLSHAASLNLGQGVRCESGSASIHFPDGSTVTFGSGCIIRRVTDHYEGEPGATVALESGQLTAEVARQPAGAAFRIVTGTAVVRVIGTRFSVASEAKATRVQVVEGVVELKRSVDGAKVDVAQGFTAIAAPGVELAATPSPPGDTRPGDDKAAATAISYLGGTGADAIVGTVIQDDGTVVLAANFSGSQWAGKTPLVLNGADASSKGILVRLSASGRTVESVTRVASSIRDLDFDAAGALFVAADEGVIKLNAAVTRIEWHCKIEFPCVRLAVTRDGAVAVLTQKDRQRVQLIGLAGAPTESFSLPFSANDIAVDRERKLVFVCGSRSGNVSKGEVGGVACLSAFAYDGKEVWKDYGFDPASKFELGSHTSGERLVLGRDGNLYGAFMAVGGNHIFSRDPKSLEVKVDLRGSDPFNQAHATGNTHITFVGRFDPATGALVASQQLLGRDKDKKGSSITPGDIAADEDGRVYLVGQARQGGPATRDAFGKAEFSNQEGFLCIFAPDLRRREFYSTFNATENGGSALRSVAARRFALSKRAAFSVTGDILPNAGGLRALDAIQSKPEGQSEGFFVVRGSGAP